MTPQEFATKIAAELRAEPHRWTREANARTIEGDKTSVASDSAVCWCLGGFVARELSPRAPTSLDCYYLSVEMASLKVALENAILREGFSPGMDEPTQLVVAWNDRPGRTVEEVIALLDAMAEAA